MGFLSSQCSGKVPQLASRGESSGFSPDAVVFLSSYNGPVRREGPLGIPPQLLPGRWSSSGVEAGTSGFLSSADMDFGVPLEFQQWSQSSSGSDMVSDMQVQSPLQQEKQCHASCRVDKGIGGFLSRCSSGKEPHLTWRGESPGLS